MAILPGGGEYGRNLGQSRWPFAPDETMKRSIVLLFAMALFAGCSDSEQDEEPVEADAGVDASDAADVATGPPTVEVDFDFDGDSQGWEADVSDFPAGAINQVAFDERVRALPTEIEDAGHGYFLEGYNTSDETDIFMFIRREIGPDDGLEPDTSYRVSFELGFASDHSRDCPNDEGDKVKLKMGAATYRPVARLDNDQTRYVFSGRKGDGGVGGDNATVAGDITHGESCDSSFDKFVLNSRNHVHNNPIATNQDGSLWLVVGVDSEMSGHNALYFTSVKATLEAVED
jgi:hypothetical protein